MHQVAKSDAPAAGPVADFMTLRLSRIAAVFVFGAVLLVGASLARAQANEPESPYGGTTVEDIIARVNDQIITQSDYNRALSEMEQEGRQRGESMQDMAAARKDLLRNLIDQQLWLAKGKELNITGETELVKRLDEIRKQYNLDSIEDLEKAAKEQGVSFEDFKANIRNQIVTQEVMRQEVGEHIQMTPGEVQRYYDEHKQDYVQPESVRLSEILISASPEDPAKLAAAKAKADDLEARLHAGGDFAQLARSFSDGTTAAQGGDLGQYKRGQLPKVLEDKTFDLSADQYTDPILTRQGYIILKVLQHTPGGPRPYKEVEQDVEEAFYMSQMDPAIRAYLNKMRDEAFIQIKQGYVDTGATPGELHSSIVFSAYVPPAPKKKGKVERTRFRESTHTFREKGGAAPPPPAEAPPAETSTPPAATPAATAPAPVTTAGAPAATAPAPESTATASAPSTTKPAKATKKNKKAKKEEARTEKPGKREKIRFGQAPRHTLPEPTTNANTENAGALPETASNAEQPANPLEPTRSTQKTRFSQRARAPKTAKPSGSTAPAASTAPAPNAAEVADQQTQSAPLGLAGDTSTKKKKKTANATGEKTRLANQKKNPAESEPKPVQQPTPIPPVPGAPAPTDHPEAPQPGQNSQPSGQ
jgi:peptidyl-prolyl cis-trans isomerase SurA